MTRDEILFSAYLFANLLLIPPALTTECCVSSPSILFRELSVSSKFTSTSTDSDGSLAWELWVNVTWIPLPEYKGYDVAFELPSIEAESFAECRSKGCEYDDDDDDGGKMRGSNWCAFFGLQYGFVYRITMYVSVAADNIRGKYVNGLTNSPDCYDETESIPFCLTQPVEYAGKPFNITTDFERIDGTNDVTVYVTWQQPIHANPDTPISYYHIAWDSDNAGEDSIDFTNFTYEPTGFLMITLSNPLQEDNNYTLSITAVVLDGNQARTSKANVSFSTYLPDEIEPDPNGNDLEDVYIYIVGGSLIVVFLSIFMVAILHRKGKRGQRTKELRIFKPTDFQPETDAATKALADYPQYEIHRDDITWEKRIMLGSGYYGEVYKCKVQIMEESMDAAVKVPKQMAIGKELEDFVEEIKQIIKLGTHENVVRFLGYNTSSNPLMMINEFVQYGDMYSFMRKIKNKKAPKDDPIYNIERINQLEIAMQIAGGMAYISSKRFLHGDLAARNILIDKGLLVKITDFGLSHDIYERNYRRMKTDEALPWRWQAIETFTERKMSSKSDVWSFGIVLSEIFKFCDPPPYHTLPSEDLVNFLKLGRRMERPPDCPQYMYEIMMRCWDVDPSRRPTFNDLYDELKQHVSLNSSCSSKGPGKFGKKPKGSHALTDTSGSSFGGIEFIREPGSEESGTGGKDKSKVTRKLISADGNLRGQQQNSYVNYAFEDSAPIDDFELSGKRIVADSTSNEMEENVDGPQLSTGRPNSNVVHEDFGFSAFNKEETTGSSTTTTGEYFVSGEFIRESEDNGSTNESNEMEENVDGPQLSTGRPNNNVAHVDFGFSAFNKEETTGSSTTTTGEYFVSGEFIRASEDSGSTNESHKMEENVDGPQLSAGRPNSNVVHEDFGFSAFNKEETTGSSTTTTGEYFVSGEFIRESEDSGSTNESHEEQSL